VAVRILQQRTALTEGLILRGPQQERPRRYRPLHVGINRWRRQVQRDRRAADRIGADGTKVGIFVCQHEAAVVFRQFRVPDAPIAGVDHPEHLDRTKSRTIELKGLCGIRGNEIGNEDPGHLRIQHLICIPIYVTDRKQMSQDVVKLRGRPPSTAARHKALAAAHDILMAEGLGRVSIEAVATRSGVGKPTIYRNWANASELAMAALMEGHPEIAPEGHGNLHTALKRQITDIVQVFATTRGRQIARALAAADPDSEMTRAFRNRIILSGREAGRRLIIDAIQRGEIAAPPDIEVILDMIYAPIFYRLLAGHLALDQAFADGLVEQGLRILNQMPTG
jgi:AcrR family transcriptional regulator